MDYHCCPVKISVRCEACPGLCFILLSGKTYIRCRIQSERMRVPSNTFLLAGLKRSEKTGGPHLAAGINSSFDGGTLVNAVKSIRVVR